jgi:hypothetical protein
MTEQHRNSVVRIAPIAGIRRRLPDAQERALLDSPFRISKARDRLQPRGSLAGQIRFSPFPASVGRKSGAHSAASRGRVPFRDARHRRNRVPGGTHFFTVNLPDRHSNRLVVEIDGMGSCEKPARDDRP